MGAGEDQGTKNRSGITPSTTTQNMKNTTQFSSETPTHNAEATPWKRDRLNNYQDLVLKPEFAERKLRFQTGETWLRILPAFQISVHGWMLGVHTLEFDGGHFAHPRTLMRNAKSVFDHAYTWALANKPDSLYSKTNKTGVRLLTNPLGVFWALIEENGKTVARLFVGSAYDGSRGGTPGLAWQVWHLTQQKDENDNLIANPAHPDEGVLICVEKNQAAGAKYPSYRLQLGRQKARITDSIAKMEPGEFDALVPLEKTIRVLTPDEEWECLGKVMSLETAGIIKNSVVK
jgi:hypothetical protein